MQQRRAKHPRSTPVPSDDTDTMPDMPFEEGAHDAVDPDMRHRLISEAAYHLYAQRGYEDGYDLDDWLQAEAEVDHIVTTPAGGPEEEKA